MDEYFIYLQRRTNQSFTKRFEIIRHDSIQIKCNKFLNFIYSKSVIYLMQKPTINYGF